MSAPMPQEVIKRDIRISNLELQSAEALSSNMVAVRLQELESENVRLQQLVAELLIKNHQLRREQTDS